VIMPTFTIISCALAVVRAGATPVYVDADPHTWNMKVEDIEPLITERTKAIMAVHIYGITVDMDPLLNIAERYDLKVIEDAAEVIGQTYKGQPCGSFGDISTLSFYPNKHITTGEGGMVLVNDDELAERCKSLRNLCFGKTDRFVHQDLGWNFRMSNLQAAIGVAQLERLPQTLEKKRAIGMAYHQNLTSSESFSLPIPQTQYCQNVYWVFGIISNHKSKNAKWWIDYLANQGVGCIFYQSLFSSLKFVGAFRVEPLRLPPVDCSFGNSNQVLDAQSDQSSQSRDFSDFYIFRPVHLH